MKKTDLRAGSGPVVSRRHVLGAASALGAMSAFPWGSLEAQVERLKEEGWVGRPVGCNMCGGACGMLLMHKPGTPFTKETVRLMPNPTHPQRGYCARGASAMWVWDHPLRIKTPLKRVGERGSGRLEPCSWDEALDAIASRVKAIVEKDGERAIALTSHDFTGYQKWFAAGLGTVNVINHSSTCNSASNAARRLVFGRGFEKAAKIEPDYEHCRFLLLNGRTLNCAIGIAGVVARARARGARVTFVDPRMPEGALTGADWIPIRPGTDMALHLSLMHVALKEGLVDEAFLRRHSNAAYLIDEEGAPVTEARCREEGSAKRFALIDERTGELVFQGPKFDEKGVAVGFDERPDVVPQLRFTGTIQDKAGVPLSVKTTFVALTEHVKGFTPEHVATITGIPAQRITKLARDFFTLGGVADDGWYGSRNGNDTGTFQAVNMLNVLAGNLDKKGGLVLTAGAGFKAPGASFAKGQGKGPQGQKWSVTPFEKKPLDKVYYPEGSGTFSAIFEAIETGKPYPIRGVFITGSTMFHREANLDRLKRALKALDLVVVQDLLPHEILDWADYVLPTTYFMESYDIANVKWNLNGAIHRFDAGVEPPAGVEARDEIWQFCEILRRAYPERAAERLGYTEEFKTRDQYQAWYRGMVDKAFKKYIAGLNDKKPGHGDAVAEHLATHGWAHVKTKTYEVFPYKKPFGTPTGKPEIYSFIAAGQYLGKWEALPTFHDIPAYKAPKPLSDEFVLISGKDSSGSSGTALFTHPQRFLGDRTVWMNPLDAQRLGIEEGDEVRLTGLDNGFEDTTRITVTNRVMAGTLFKMGFQGGVRKAGAFAKPGYDWVREGINSHAFCTGYREPITGSVSNNCSVRVTRLKA